MSEKNKKPKLVVILGPTASGKSDIAVALAKKFNGEIISADSRQVYKELNIGTGKITKKEMRGVPHHLLDVADPRQKFTVADFVKYTNKTIVQIVSENKLPIICGGTGFYIDALLGEKQIPEVPPNLKLRKELEKKTVEELFEILKKLDPERAKNIDAKNPRRLVRAIEICKALGSVPKLAASSQQLAARKYEVLKIGIASIKKELTHPRPPHKRERCGQAHPSLKLREGAKGESYVLDEETLKSHINKRIEKWFRQGLLKEVSGLHKKGLSWKRMSEIGLEYKIVSDHLRSKSHFAKAPRDKQEMVEQMQKETWQYAKRQMTWFKKDKNIIWMQPKINLVQKQVKRFVSEASLC